MVSLKHCVRKLAKVILVACLMFFCMPSFAFATASNQEEGENITTSSVVNSALSITRLGGTDRFHSSYLAATYNRTSSEYALVVSSEESNWPDAAIAAGVAGLLDAPVIITSPTKLESRSKQALVELDVQEIYIIGSYPSISESVESALKDIVGDNNVHRIAGADRYETAEAAYNEFASSVWVNPNVTTQNANPTPLANVSWKNSGGKKSAILVTGANWPDAVSASSLAYLCHYPVFLVPDTGVLTDATRSILQNGNFDSLIVFGDSMSISDTTALDAATLISPYSAQGKGSNWYTRLAGTDRYDTAFLAVQETIVFEHCEMDALTAVSGDAEADAVSGMGIGNPIIYAGNASGPYERLDEFIFAFSEAFHEVVVVGAENTLPDSVITVISNSWFDWSTVSS